MATKGDISCLDVLQYGGKPMIPLVSGFSRTRRTGVVQNQVMAGATRQRKKFYGNTYVAEATFYLRNAQQQDYIKQFFARNEGKTFICHLAADRPIVEPYTVRVISDWQDSYVSSVDGALTVTIEIDSVRCPELDDFLFPLYECAGDETYGILFDITKVVRLLP